jgi:hypothetical protein
MSKEEKRKFIKKLLSESVRVSGVNCRVSVADMFSRFSKVVVVVRRKNGSLSAVGM